MVPSHEVILVLYGVATGVGITLAVVVWRHRDAPGAVPFTAAMIGTALFSGPRFVATAVDSIAVSIAMERLLYVGVGLSVMAIFLFALEYTGREHLVTRTTVAALSVEPIAVVVLAFANQPLPRTPPARRRADLRDHGTETEERKGRIAVSFGDRLGTATAATAVGLYILLY